MTTIDRDIYQRARDKGFPAKLAASFARPVEGPTLDWQGNPGDSVTFEHEGFDVRVYTNYDEGLSDEDLGYGRWVWTERYADWPERRPEPEAIAVPYNQHTEAKWYVPSQTLAEVAAYEHKRGASKSVALDLARARQKAELEDVLGNGYGPEVRIVKVTVCKSGVSLAHDTVGGVEIGWDPITRTDGTRYLAEVAYEMLPEVIEEARDKLAELREVV